MDIGEAIKAAKAGARIARAGWNGKGMWVSYSPGSDWLPADKFWSEANRKYVESLPGQGCTVKPCLTMRCADGEILMGWLASQTDLLATDWEIV
jgi:hypothetical protein